MLFKRCSGCPRGWLTCGHGWWVQGKRKPLGRVRESLEVYFERPVRGKGGRSIARDLEKLFLADLRTGKYAEWKKAREISKTPPTIPTTRTWTKFIDFYITEHILANKLRWDWAYKYKVKQIRNRWAERSIETITVADVQTYLNQFAKRGCAPATATYHFAVIRHMLKFAARMQWIEESPLKPDSITLPKVRNERTRRLLEEEEAALWPILDAMAEEPSSDGLPARRFLKGVVTMTLDTGLRRGSILALTFGMVKWDQGAHGMLDIPAEILKQRRPQQLALTKRAREVIEGRRRFYFSQGRFKPETVIFGKDNGTIFKGTCAFEQAWQEAKRRAGLKDLNLHFHDLRGEAASRLSEMGIPLPAIQRFLGHRSLEMTQRYLRARVGEAEDTASAMELFGEQRATKGATREANRKSS